MSQVLIARYFANYTSTGASLFLVVTATTKVEELETPLFMNEYSMGAIPLTPHVHNSKIRSHWGDDPTEDMKNELIRHMRNVGCKDESLPVHERYGQCYFEQPFEVAGY